MQVWTRLSAHLRKIIEGMNSTNLKLERAPRQKSDRKRRTHWHKQFDAIPIPTDFEYFGVVFDTGHDMFSIAAETFVQTVVAEKGNFKKISLLFNA